MEPEQTTQNQPVVATSPLQSYAIPFAIVIAGLAIAGAIYFGDSTSGAASTTPPSARKDVSLDTVTAKDHLVGNPNAKLIVVEYSDPECPFCKTFHPTMQRIMSEYGASGNVAWVYRHFPLSFHTKAPKEVEAIECAAKLGGNNKFWEYLNKIFEVTPANNGLDPAELPKIATSLSLDEQAFTACLSSGEMKAVVDAGLMSGAKAGVAGTPQSFLVVNGKIIDVVEGAQPYEVVKAKVDAALK